MAWVTKTDVFRFLESTGGTALITILLGSLGASAVSYVFQAALQRRDQQAAEYQDKLSRRRATVEQVYDLVGAMITRTEALTEVMQEQFDSSTYEPGASDDIAAQHRQIREEYNQTDIDWRRQQMTLTMKIGESLGDTTEAQWGQLATAVENFKRCTLRVASERRVIEFPDTVCRCEKVEVVEQVRNFSRVLSESMYASE